MKSQKGFSLIEVLVSLAVLGIIGLSFSSALDNTSRVTLNTDELQTARSLAGSQMEFVKGEAFAASYTPAPVPTEYNGYTVAVTVTPLRDGNVQQVTVIVSHSGKETTRVESFKIR
jgi:prepilin-type N-terminal cleavage/methylation domain-containing protein